MINRIDSLLKRPERGWDPVPADYANEYARASWDTVNTSSVVDELERRLGSLAGKTVLDLGAGPGHYSVALAQRGAKVTWHDVSRSYLDIAGRRAEDAGVDIEFSLGYLEDAAKFRDRPFDLVLCMLAWYYCMDDKSFAGLVYDIAKPGGAVYIDCNTANFESPRPLRKVLYAIDRTAHLKVGHLYPPHGRIVRLFHAFPIEEIIVDYSSKVNDRVFLIKKQYA